MCVLTFFSHWVDEQMCPEFTGQEQAPVLRVVPDGAARALKHVLRES